MQTISIKNLTKTYTSGDNTVTAVDNVSLELPTAKLIALTGRSGSGKSTLLYNLAALLKPTSGTITIDETDPYKFSPPTRNKFRAKNIGILYPDFRLLPYLTIAQNIATPALALNWSSEKIESRTQELIKTFHLTARQNHLPNALSSGEQQRTALARALFTNPTLIIADEPTGNLDEESTQAIIKTLQAQTETGTTVITATHDPLIIQAADLEIQMTNGKIPPNF